MTNFDYQETEKYEAELKKQQIEAREKLRELLESKIAREHFYRMFQESFIFTTTFTKSSESFFNEGKRQMALDHFNAILDLDPYIFAQMCVEFNIKEDANTQS